MSRIQIRPENRKKKRIRGRTHHFVVDRALRFRERLHRVLVEVGDDDPSCELRTKEKKGEERVIEMPAEL